MATNIEEMLDQLYTMIDEAKSMPLSSDKCILERDRALDLLDDIRGKFPMELKKAKELLNARNDYIASAKREADSVRKLAEEQARKTVEEDELVRQAKQRGEEIVEMAEERSRQLKKAANEYCEDTLRRTEEAVAEAYDEVKRSHAKFRSALNAGAAASSGRVAYDAAADEA